MDYKSFCFAIARLCRVFSGNAPFPAALSFENIAQHIEFVRVCPTEVVIVIVSAGRSHASALMSVGSRAPRIKRRAHRHLEDKHFRTRRKASFHHHVRRSEHAGRNVHHRHVAKGDERNSALDRVGRHPGRASCRNVLPGLAGVVEPTGRRGRARDSGLMHATTSLNEKNERSCFSELAFLRPKPLRYLRNDQ